MEYPEHEKLSAISDQSQAIGQFLDWLQNEKAVTLAEYLDEDGGHWGEARLVPIHRSIQHWLAEYFGIDLEVIETEKREMLDKQRRLNETLDSPN